MFWYFVVFILLILLMLLMLLIPLMLLIHLILLIHTVIYINILIYDFYIICSSTYALLLKQIQLIHHWWGSMRGYNSFYRLLILILIKNVSNMSHTCIDMSYNCRINMSHTVWLIPVSINMSHTSIYMSHRTASNVTIS